MLAYQGLGDTAAAERERALYERSRPTVGPVDHGRYRQLHPYDNNERQSVHEHVLEGRPGTRALARPAPAAAPATTRRVDTTRRTPQAEGVVTCDVHLALALICVVAAGRCCTPTSHPRAAPTPSRSPT